MNKDLTESEVKKQILDWLEIRGAYPCILGAKSKSIYRSRYLRAGIPDLLCFWKKEVVFIEVKKKRGVVSEEQAEFMHRAMESGINCYLVYSLEELILMLEPH